MSHGITVDWSGLEAVQDKLQTLGDLQTRGLLENVGALVESQTRRRIQEEKQGPDGETWVDWSEDYADSHHGRYKNHKPHPGQTRRADNHSLLQLNGGLLDSIMYEVEPDGVRVGSNLVYAAAHQFGTDDVPARPYLGLSQANEREVENLVLGFLAEVLT